MESSGICRLSEDEWYVHNTLPFVFPYLKSSDLLRAAQVCKLWHDVASDSRLWKTAVFKNNRIRIDSMSDFLAPQGTVNLSLVDCIFVNKDPNFLVRELQKITSLRSLELSKFRTVFIHRLPQISRNLEKIDVEVIDEHFTRLNLEFLQILPNVSRLNLDLRSKEINRVSIDSINYLKNLRHLSLMNVRNLQSVNLDVLADLKNLESLELGTPNRSFYTDVLRRIVKLNRLVLGRPKFRTIHSLMFISRNRENIEEHNLTSIMKDLKSLKKLELIDGDEFYEEVTFCENLQELVVVPGNERNLCGQIILLNESNITHFTLGIRVCIFNKYVQNYKFCHTKQVVLNDFFGLRETPSTKLLLDTIFERDFDKFLSQLQILLSELLPKISVKVIDYHDRRAGCNWNCNQYRKHIEH